MGDEEDFETLIKNIQNNIDKEEEKCYSKKVIDEYRSPSNFGFIKNPDARAEIKGSCGDTMKIDLKISTNRISEARFWTDGCGASISCGSKLTKMIKGKTLQETKNFTSTNLLDSLGGLPSENRHCAVLAVDTLKACIKKYNLEKRKK